MKTSVFVIGLLLLSSMVLTQVPKQKTHDTKAHLSREQVIKEATKDAVEKLNKIKAELEKCIKEGKKCEIAATLTKKVHQQKHEVQEKKAAVTLQIDSAQAKGTVKYYKIHLKDEKKSPKHDDKKIKIYQHDLRVALRDQEKLESREKRRLKRSSRRKKRR